MAPPRPSHVTRSVVVVSKDDEGLSQTLERLVVATEGADDVEVIVVDASQGRLDAIRKAFPSVRWVAYEQPAGKRRTIAEQRNLGVASAAGTAIAFVDASCVPIGPWLDRLTVPILAGEEAIVAGSVRAERDSRVHSKIEPRGAGEYLSEFSNLNVAICRDAFERIGGFDESLGYAEDVDFAWRASDAGTRIRFEPEAMVSHDWGTFRHDLTRARRYGIGRARLYRKHWRRWRAFVRSDFYIFAYAAFVLCSPVAIVAPGYLALAIVPVALNRRHHPFATLAYQLTMGLGLLTELVTGRGLGGARRARRRS